MLKEVFSLDEFEIEEAITDGGMDKGIDAIFEKEDERLQTGSNFVSFGTR